MTRANFIRNLIGFYGIGSLPLAMVQEYQKIYLLQCFVRGFQYYQGPKLIDKINGTGMLELVREPKNKYDNNAIALYFNQKKIGFIPAESNEILSRLLDAQLLQIQAEITHVVPEAAPWENVHIALFALKKVTATEQSQDYKALGILETPTYYSLKTGDNRYTRIFWDFGEEKEMDVAPTDYYRKMVHHSSNDAVYDLIHNSFNSPEDFDLAFQESRLIIRKSEKILENINCLFETLHGEIVSLENVFGDKGYVVANVDEIAQIPDQIQKFAAVLDKKGNTFFEVILKVNQ